MLKANAGVLRSVQKKTETHSGRKWKRRLWLVNFPERSARKFTIGISGLWRSNVHNKVALLSCVVGSCYNYEVDFAKRSTVRVQERKGVTVKQF